MSTTDETLQEDDELQQHRKEWGDNQDEIKKQKRIACLKVPFRIAVYEQKYQMMRHFDSLRWTIPTYPC